ncbi:hypothetical protein TKK_0014707 [Trichogramma kaykai]
MNPAILEYDIPNMRDHLYHIIKEEKFELFPCVYKQNEGKNISNEYAQEVLLKDCYRNISMGELERRKIQSHCKSYHESLNLKNDNHVVDEEVISKYFGREKECDNTESSDENDDYVSAASIYFAKWMKAKTCNEVAVVFVGNDGVLPIDRDVCIFSRPQKKPTKLPIISKHTDPMTYPLIFPCGGQGWCPNIKLCKSGDNLSTCDFYKYRFAIRGKFNQYLQLGRITQQFVIDAWIKVEHSKLYFIRKNQPKLRTDMYRGLIDYLTNKLERENTKIGKMVILPSSYTGSPRACRENYLDSMILVQVKGKPDLFVTITCNPLWKEIIDNISNHELAADRPDVVVRVFHEKMKMLRSYLTKLHIFGKAVAFTYVIEFQKRGLLHAHLLLWLSSESKIRNADDVDKIISAEIPDENVYPRFYEIVKKFMIHGPCGYQNATAPCMDVEKNRCTKNFLKKYNDTTVFNANGYPLYRRRQDNTKIIFKHKGSNRIADNRYVVPYNPYLLLKYNCHINVEVCTTVLCIKYLFKYCYKGHDCAMVKVSNNAISEDKDNTDEDQKDYNEIDQYINTRYLCPPEAIYRINKYKLHHISHAIVRLAVHKENEQNVYYKKNEEDAVLTKNVNTTLTAWFALNAKDTEANKYFYHDIPYHYVFNDKQKMWTVRKKMTKPVLSRMYQVNPKEKEKYYLRLLLLHVRGAKSFNDVKTHQNVTYETYFEAVRSRNLIKIDTEWDLCLSEAVKVKFPYALCELFANICIYHNPINVLELFNKYKTDFYHPSMCDEIGTQWASRQIENILSINGHTLSQFDLPDLQSNVEYNSACIEHNVIDNTVEGASVESRISMLTVNQKIIFEEISKYMEDPNRDRCIFIDGPGGSGKSFLINCVIDYLLKTAVSVLPVAWTGIASNLLRHGRTSHIASKLPLDINENTVCNVTPNSKYVDGLMKDINNNDKTFGGKIIIVSGDFRQTLPIVRHGSRTQVIENCIKKSHLWEKFKSFSLFENKRLTSNDENFKKWLLRVGEGKRSNQYEFENEFIYIPDDLICESEEIITEIYGCEIRTDDESTHNKVILAPTNAKVMELNTKILSKIEGEIREYVSTDSVVNDPGDNDQFRLKF